MQANANKHLMSLKLRDTIKKIWYSLYNSGRIVLLDYPIKPMRIYKEEKDRPHEVLYNLIDENKLYYRQVLQSTLKYNEVFAAIKEEKFITNDTEPGWNNGHLPGLDIIILYSLIAQIRPSKYVEIGSGTSTKVAYKSRMDNLLSFEIISIDPRPRKNIKKVADKIYQKNIQEIGFEVFDDLKENDMVFLDGTHTLFPNSDVMWFFLEIFPKLKKGVIVHIHDVYLPYDYPDFMCDRYYNEQYLLGALLLSNKHKYEILSPNYFIYTNKELHGILKPIWELNSLGNVESHGGSFWMKIRSG
jgi:hypothetical protein